MAWFSNDGYGTFASAARVVSTRLQSAQCVLAVDLNGDGWLDLLTREINGEVSGYIAACGAEGWTTIELKGLGANPGAIGATVLVTTTDLSQTRWVTLGATGLQSSVPGVAHFGLGAATLFDVDVTWPDGATSHFSGQSANRHLVIERQH